MQLREKQKMRRIYGMLERQFRKTYAEATSSKGITGETLLQLLECRLDTVAYRMGFGASRSEARQIVRHNGILVNGKRVNIPSYQCVRATSWKSPRRPRSNCASRARSRPPRPRFPGMARSRRQGAQRHVQEPPQRTDLPSTINESLVVELYSK